MVCIACLKRLESASGVQLKIFPFFFANSSPTKIVNYKTRYIQMVINKYLHLKKCEVCKEKFYGIASSRICDDARCKRINNNAVVAKRYRRDKAMRKKMGVSLVSDFATEAKKRRLTYGQLQQLETLGRL